MIASRPFEIWMLPVHTLHTTRAGFEIVRDRGEFFAPLVVASVTTRDAALAALRLLNVDSFEDWT